MWPLACLPCVRFGETDNVWSSHDDTPPPSRAPARGSHRDPTRAALTSVPGARGEHLPLGAGFDIEGHQCRLPVQTPH